MTIRAICRLVTDGLPTSGTAFTTRSSAPSYRYLIFVPGASYVCFLPFTSYSNTSVPIASRFPLASYVPAVSWFVASVTPNDSVTPVHPFFRVFRFPHRSYVISSRIRVVPLGPGSFTLVSREPSSYPYVRVPAFEMFPSPSYVITPLLNSPPDIRAGRLRASIEIWTTLPFPSVYDFNAPDGPYETLVTDGTGLAISVVFTDASVCIPAL
ncbi:MAG: hypothetical protein DIJKHBIC_00547 [Thermoanaerobaculia bacterium]|nr:hypothetical protein [Thermoanaerobaculia bacterium]